MEAAGLAIGVVGMASLFTTCIEAFDIVVRAREFGQEFDLLCTQLSLQRVRLLLWGETLGLVPDLPSTTSPYHYYYHRLEDDNKIAPAIESTLHHLRSLLQTADLITDRYAIHPGPGSCTGGRGGGGDVQVEPSKGLTIFRDRFDSFKARVRRNQNAKSTWTVTRWAIHDLSKFREVITNIKDLIDGLEGITSAVGLLLERQHALLRREVDSIYDAESLRLLQDVAKEEEASADDERSPSLKLLSDAASARLSVISNSPLSETLHYSRTSILGGSSSCRSYRTALSHRFDAASIPSLVEELSEDEVSILAEVPSLSAEEDLEEARTGGERSRNPVEGESAKIDQGMICTTDPSHSTHDKPLQQQNLTIPFANPETVPQNRRLISDLLRKIPSTTCNSSSHAKLSFTPESSAAYGNALSHHKQADTSLWTSQSTRFLVHADKGSLSARRIFLELRSIQSANIPFISAAPLDDSSLDKLIARIEGPPDTPYEGGVFWILVSFPSMSTSNTSGGLGHNDGGSMGAPTLRFLTKIYHPNIDCQGNICGGGGDNGTTTSSEESYRDWWNDLEQIGTRSTSSARQPKAPGPWFSSRKANWFSLGALLTALCGLLATPDVQDPLVAEIAETYLRDYEEYCAIARLYTRRYAGRDAKPRGTGSTVYHWEQLSENWGGSSPTTTTTAGGEDKLQAEGIDTAVRRASPSLDVQKVESDGTISSAPTLELVTPSTTNTTRTAESTCTWPTTVDQESSCCCTSYNLSTVPEFEDPISNEHKTEGDDVDDVKVSVSSPCADTGHHFGAKKGTSWSRYLSARRKKGISYWISTRSRGK